MRIGKTVFFHISLTMGSTTTFGSGLWLFSTPSNIVSTFHGEARLNDNSAGGPWEQGFNTQSATAEFFASRYDSLGVTATVPFTWATSDVLVLTGMYEEA